MSEIALMVKVARLYYEEGRTQANIATELGITRLSVIELLKNARAEGIVRLEIVNPEEDFRSLEESIALKFGLKKVIIASGGGDPAMLLSRMGKSAAAYLDEILKINDVLGIGWGLSVMETSTQLKHVQKRAITTVPLIGGGNETFTQYDVNDLTKKFANSFGGESFSLFAPAMMDSKAIRDAIISDSRIRRVTNFWKHLNVVLIGIGIETIVSPSTLEASHPSQPLDFKSMGIAGDILSRFFDSNGNNISLEMHERMIGIDLDTIKTADEVIGVSGGLTKYNAIYGAIKGKFIDTLITDEKVARKLDMA